MRTVATVSGVACAITFIALAVLSEGDPFLVFGFLMLAITSALATASVRMEPRR